MNNINENGVDEEFINERYKYDDNSMNNYLNNSNNPNLFYTDSLATPEKNDTENLKNPKMSYTDTLANPNNVYSPFTNKLYDPYGIKDEMQVNEESFDIPKIAPKEKFDKYNLAIVIILTCFIILSVFLLVYLL